MNHRFDRNNISSDNSKNEFMINQQSISMSTNPIGENNDINYNSAPNQMQKMLNYMKNVFSNPSLMNQMEKFMTIKQAQKNSSFLIKQNQSLQISRMSAQIRQQSQSFVIQPSQQAKPEPLRMVSKQNMKKIKSPEISASTLARKKGADIFSAYINDQEDNQREQPTKKDSQRMKKTQQRSPVQISKPISCFDEIPIKSNYIENRVNGGNELLANNPAYYPENEVEPYTKRSANNSKANNNYKNIAKKPKTIETNINYNKYAEMQERPINGTKQDFKDLLKQKFEQSPFDSKPVSASNFDSNSYSQSNQQQYQNQDDREDDREDKPKREFLKRGSRQYLSSAKDKKEVRKKQAQNNKNKELQENLNSSRVGQRNDRDVTPSKRDVSQNRILSKRNANNADKSTSKLKQMDKSKPNKQHQNTFQEQKQQSCQHLKLALKTQGALNKNKSPVFPPKSSKPINKASNSIQNLSNSGNGASGRKKNVFDDSSSQDQQFENQQKNNLKKNNFVNTQSQNVQKKSYQPQKQFDMFSRQKKQEVVDGVYLTHNQLKSIVEKHAPKMINSSKNKINNNASQQKFNQLRKKYTDLCNLLQKQKIQHEEQMEKQRQQFQNYKQQQLQKIKNQRRVMQRQMKSTMPSQTQNLQKDKQEIDNLKKEIQKQRDQHKKKEKNNKILIEKYKKQNEELKIKLQKLQESQKAQKPSNITKSSLPQSQFISNPSNNKSNTNDKSKSKLPSKDVSPAKLKINKKPNANQQNEEDGEVMNDTNYKKTIPLYKGGNKQKHTPQNENKNQSKYQEENSDSGSQHLPTFKVDSKKLDDQKTKVQKKYQYIQNPNGKGTQQSKNLPNNLNHVRNGSNHQSKGKPKNAFADDYSDQQYVNKQQSEEQNSENQAIPFKPKVRFQKLSDLMSNNFSVKSITPQLIQGLLTYGNNSQYLNYFQKINNPKRLVVNSSKNGLDKKMTNVYNDRSKEILFENGTKKQIFEDGYTIIYFKNGDIKQKLVDGTILYYFKEKQVDQITLINGVNIYRFQNNQVQVHYDGGKYIQIRNPDGTIKMLGSPIH